MDKNIKVGAMISANNKKKTQAVHDYMIELGASCEATEQEAEDKSLSPMKMMKLYEMGGLDYARSEKWDIQNATYALNSILGMSDIDYGEKENVARLVKIARGIVEFINIELNELEQAVVSANVMAKSFSIPKDTELNLSYVKSIGLDDVKSMAVKYVSRDEIKGYTFLWGSPKLTDVEIEYFTTDTNFWDDVLGKSARPLTWDHAQDEEFKASPVIGNITDFGDDEIGRWYIAKLDTSHKYKEAIRQLIKSGALGTSSDSAPQYVVREQTGKSTWLKQWPWFASALTNTPAEPRMIDSLEFLKSLGIVLPDVNDIHLRYEHKKRQSELLKLKYHIEQK